MQIATAAWGTVAWGAKIGNRPRLCSVCWGASGARHRVPSCSALATPSPAADGARSSWHASWDAIWLAGQARREPRMCVLIYQVTLPTFGLLSLMTSVTCWPRGGNCRRRRFDVLCMWRRLSCAHRLWIECDAYHNTSNTQTRQHMSSHAIS
jgi:hypothetical protein